MKQYIDEEYEASMEEYVEELETEVARLEKCNKVLKYAAAVAASVAVIAAVAVAVWHFTI
jgi:exonuclease VII small subunit